MPPPSPIEKKMRRGFPAAACIGLLAIWLFAWREIDDDRKENIEQAETRAQLKAQMYAEATRPIIKRIDNLLVDLRDDWNGDWKRMAEKIVARQALLQDLTFQMSFIDADGRLIFSNLAPPNDRTDLGDREHFTVHRDAPHGEDRLFISRPVKGRVSGKWSIQFTRPLIREGRFAGVIVASISPLGLSGLHGVLKLGERGASSILRDSGEVMARQPDLDEMLGKIVKWPYDYPSAPPEGHFHFVSKLDFVDRIFGYYKIPEYGWTFFAGEAEDEILSGHVEVRRKLLAIALAASIAYVTALALLARQTLLRLRLEEKRRRDDLRYRSLIDAISHSGTMLLLIDSKGCVRYMNPSFEAALGNLAEELCIKNIGATDQLPCPHCLSRHIVDQDNNEHYLLDLDDGRWLDLVSQPFQDEDGTACRLQIIHDVTARYRAELQLKDNEQRLGNIIWATGVGTWEWNVQTGETRFNERWAEIIGRTLDELGPCSIQTWLDLAHPDDLAKSSELLKRHFAGESDHYECEARMRHRDGRWIWVLDRGRLLTRTADGQPEWMAGTHWDITDRKEAETELIEAKRAADSANFAKSRFLATMSHEIRTPMNGILGMAQMLLQGKPDDESYHESARTILHAGQALLTLLNDILDLSKIEAGRLTLEQGIVAPDEIVQESLMLFENSARQKGLDISCHWEGPSGQRYQGDAHRLHQMLNNLVGNAVKFTAQGQVRINAREVGDGTDAASIEFSVSDTGPGIAEEKENQLFMPFSQLDNSLARQFGGSGLGLSIVRCLAELMHGEVGVSSRPGEGARFWFRVPLPRIAGDSKYRADDRTVPVPDNQPTSLAGRVLVAEDNITNRLVIQAMLRNAGIEVQSVENGQQAVDMIASGTAQFDAIIMDVQMPVMDGYEATRRLRELERSQQRPRLPIIALTADAFPEDRRRCLDVGMDDFLAKPVMIDELLAALARWLPTAKHAATQPVTRQLDLAAYEAQAQALDTLLAECKFEAIDRFAELEALAAGTPLAGHLAEIRPAVMQIRFAEARQALKRIPAQGEAA